MVFFDSGMFTGFGLNRLRFALRSRSVARRCGIHAPKWAHLGPFRPNDDTSGGAALLPYKYPSRLSFFSFSIRLRYSLSSSLLLSLAF